MTPQDTVVNPALAGELVATAHALADAARAVTLAHFRSTDLAAENKAAGGFDPVTLADRGAEERMRAILAERRPQDAILGEEYGTKAGDSGLTWVLDPIDGTRGFISGMPTWGVLISVRDANAPLYGLIDQPWIGERFEGGFGISRMAGPRGEAPLRARKPRPLREAVLFSTFPEVGTPTERNAFERVARQVRLVRYGADCYAYALLALGQIDLVIEAGLQPYDIQAPIAVIEAAGGIVTDWQGGACDGGGQVIAASSPEIHAEAMALLNGG